MSNFMRIFLVGAELFHTVGRTDNGEANSRLSQFCERAQKPPRFMLYLDTVNGGEFLEQLIKKESN
jgi:hypothetical protein